MALEAPSGGNNPKRRTRIGRDALRSAAVRRPLGAPGRRVRVRRTERSGEQPGLPTTSPGAKRRELKELIHKNAVVQEATVQDIPDIIAIYEQLYYDRDAFVLLSDPVEVARLETSSKEDDNLRVENARKELSGGGEFAHITAEEWATRITSPGERVLLLKYNGKIIGVNSYCLGPAAEEEIAERFSKIDLNHDGQKWQERAERTDRSRPAKDLIMIRDTFFPPDMQGMNLFMLSYVWMLIYEMSQDPEALLVNPVEYTQKAIYYFVNRIEAIWQEGNAPHEPDLADSINVNNHTVVAGLKPPLRAKMVGMTPGRRAGGAQSVPSLDGDRTAFVTSEAGKRIQVLKGYQDLLIYFKNLTTAIRELVKGILHEEGHENEVSSSSIDLSDTAERQELGERMRVLMERYRAHVARQGGEASS